MSKTNTGLVAYCKAQLGKPYWYGTFGQTASKSLHNSKKAQYPNYYLQSKYKVRFYTQYGQRVHDCVGLIKGYLWSANATAKPKYNSAQDVSANGMLSKCKEKGKIKTLPEIAGVLVFFDGHVGVYEGNGKVLEARGHDYGVVRTNLKVRPWTNWGKCPWIEYPDTNTTKPAVKPAETKPKVSYYPKYDGKSLLIDTVFKAIGVPSSMRGKYKNRMPIAKANGISDYKGTAKQNIQLINLAKKGKLIKP